MTVLLTQGVSAVHGVNGYSASLFLHILLFVYWLGGDLGVYYSSRYILKPELSPETRGGRREDHARHRPRARGSAWCCSCRAA